MEINGQPQLHRIPLAKAKEMTLRYRQNRDAILKEEWAGQNLLAICETFSKESFNDFFTNDQCKGIRIYYGMNSDMLVHAIVVGVDDQNRDMLPTGNMSLLRATAGAEDEEEPPILEEGTRCPDDCPPPSDLNQP
ncbi:MAG: hypothetical protein INR73_19715 [Williamsia sp.]|nr:hypothetical protein [Williamsia sp.]